MSENVNVARDWVRGATRGSGWRLIARVRSRTPLLFFTPAMVIMQCLSGADGAFRWVVWGAAIVAAFALLTGRSSLLAAGVLAGTITGTVAEFERSSPVTAPFAKTMVGVVADTPRFHSPGAVDLSLVAIEYPDPLTMRHFAPRRPLKLHCRGVDLPWRNLSSEGGRLHVGSSFVFTATISPLQREGYRGGWDRALAREGFHGRCEIITASQVVTSVPSLRDRMRGWLAERVRSLTPTPTDAAPFLSLALGARDQLSRREESYYRATGLMHVLVLSGYQVALLFHGVVALVGRAWRLLGWRVRPASLAGAEIVRWGALAVTAGALAIIGLDQASLRALVALGLGVVAYSRERRSDLLTVALATLTILAAVDPGCILDPSVQLTFLALTGIALGQSRGAATPWERYLAVMTWASVCTAPVTAWVFGTFSLIGFIVNPLLVPIISYVGVVGVVTALGVGVVSEWGARGVMGICTACLHVIHYLIEWLGTLPGALFEVTPLGAAAITVGAVIVCVHGLKRSLEQSEMASEWVRWWEAPLERNIFREPR